MGNANGNNILFFFDTKIIKERLDKKIYINRLDSNIENIFYDSCHYIIAGARAIHDMLKNQHKDIDEIICVSDLGDENREYFESSFNKIFENDINLTLINYKSNDSSDIILTYISDEYTFSENDTIYILTNGGPRNNVMFFSTFTQIIQAKGVDTKLIYIDQGSPKEKTETIKDVTSDNKYFDVLRAVEMFIQSGNPKKLKEIYAPTNNTTALSELLGYMEKFYKNIQICKPVNDDSDIVRIYEKMLDEIDNLMKTDNDVDIIIRLLLPTIKSKFMPLGEEYNEPLFQILQWCCNNDMILTGFFILDAEYKNYLYRKEVIQFNGFEKNGKTVYLTSTDSEVIKNLGVSDDETKDKAKKEIQCKKQKEAKFDKDKYYEEKDKKQYIKYINSNRISYSECLTIIFRYIVKQTRDTGLNTNSMDDNLNKIKMCLKDWEICLYPYNKKNLKLYELILLQDFIRNLRNSMAHSNIKSTIKDKENVRSFVRDKFGEEIFSPPNNNDITFDDIGIYDKLKFILEQSIKIIQENVKYISVEVKENGN